jgi:hypothetical protein
MELAGMSRGNLLARRTAILAPDLPSGTPLPSEIAVLQDVFSSG